MILRTQLILYLEVGGPVQTFTLSGYDPDNGPQEISYWWQLDNEPNIIENDIQLDIEQ